MRIKTHKKSGSRTEGNPRIEGNKVYSVEILKEYMIPDMYSFIRMLYIIVIIVGKKNRYGNWGIPASDTRIIPRYYRIIVDEKSANSLSKTLLSSIYRQ